MSANIYQKITDRIVSEMEKGIIPWQRPWTGGADGAYSFATKKPYSLLNQMLLGKRGGAYITFNQVKERGGSIKKGAKSDSIYFYKFIRQEVENEEGEKRLSSYPVLHEYRVFHIEDTTLEQPADGVLQHEFLPHEEAERIASAYVDREGIILEDDQKSGRAYYTPSFDKIVVPMRSQFKGEGEFYSTLFHEMVHSTGHYSRLNRLTKMAAFGSEEYSKEELVAELGAATMAMRLGFESKGTFRNSVGYIQGWLSKLKSDIRLLPIAAALAEKAIRMIEDKEKE